MSMPNQPSAPDSGAEAAAKYSTVVNSTVINNWGDRDDAFVPLKLEWLRGIDPPRDTAQLAGRARERRVLMIGGRSAEKQTCARAVALFLADEQPPEGQEKTLRPLEWQPGAAPENLLRDIQKQQEPAILILQGIQPRHVRNELRQLQELAEQGRHFIITTTTIPKAVWNGPGREAEAYWYEPPLKELFDADTLTSRLVQGLQRVVERLPHGAFQEASEPGRSLLKGVPLARIAKVLRTLDAIDAFVDRLSSWGRHKPLTGPDIEALIKDATSGWRQVAAWFDKGLEQDDQVLAIGMSLFEGLFDDQFFAAIERWVTHIRGHRNPAQRAFDYVDARKLQGTFDLVETDSAGMKVEGGDPDTRQFVLRAAWQTHRRLIIGALPVLTELAVQSVNLREGDQELYGPRERRSQVRYAVGTAISVIGRLSAEAVQQALLRLAADEDIEVQAVAALAMALWREEEEGHDRSEQLFETLERWRKDVRVHSALKAILGIQEGHATKSIRRHILATLALTVAYAAQYDAPNALHPRLLELLKQLVDEGDTFVRSRFGAATLPFVAIRHVGQLHESGLLLKVMAHEGLTRYLGKSLAVAYRRNPEEVTRILEAWRVECARARTEHVSPGKTSHRERMLMTLAVVYGELAETLGFERLHELLATESHPRVREEAMHALVQQAERRFEQVEPYLRSLVADITLQEHDNLVTALVKLYLSQRAELTGGDGTWERKGDSRKYPVWLGGDRSQLTSVERAMLRWLQDGENPAAQRIALLASLAFARNMDEQETLGISTYHDAQQQAEEQERNTRIPASPTRAPAPSWYTRVLVPRAATLGASRYGPVIAGLLPEALNRHQNTEWRNTLSFVLEQWPRVWGKEAAEIARYLRRALSLHPHLWKVLVGSGCLMGGTLFGLFFLR